MTRTTVASVSIQARVPGTRKVTISSSPSLALRFEAEEHSVHREIHGALAHELEAALADDLAIDQNRPARRATVKSEQHLHGDS
jgi:hypothetical protein